MVTGAAHGLGRAICVTLAAAGAAVVACDIEAEGLGDTEAAVARATGRPITALAVDVTDPAAVAAAAAGIASASGPIGILVNNAGGVGGQTMRPVDEVDPDAWRQLIAINLDGTFNCVRSVVPQMRRRGSGAIVNISSGAGRTFSLTGIQAYAAAKAGVIGLTRQLAKELGPAGIRVNCVAPGFVRSNPTTERQWAAMGATGQARLLESIALRRLGRAEEIALAVRFLLSDDAAYVTGQTLGVDGGNIMLG
ncbi:MAG TPA: SDR family NAD(P)-dependent oxidoreductase [Candidatus Micrarchaeia archaeon]|nr:SDR family NAD(P)-dependent oxidoreductase [Candidatus Micrarchaeia archaeon]